MGEMEKKLLYLFLGWDTTDVEEHREFSRERIINNPVLKFIAGFAQYLTSACCGVIYVLWGKCGIKALGMVFLWVFHYFCIIGTCNERLLKQKSTRGK